MEARLTHQVGEVTAMATDDHSVQSIRTQPVEIIFRANCVDLVRRWAHALHGRIGFGSPYGSQGRDPRLLLSRTWRWGLVAALKRAFHFHRSSPTVRLEHPLAHRDAPPTAGTAEDHPIVDVAGVERAALERGLLHEESAIPRGRGAHNAASFGHEPALCLRDADVRKHAAHRVFEGDHALHRRAHAMTAPCANGASERAVVEPAAHGLLLRKAVHRAGQDEELDGGLVLLSARFRRVARSGVGGGPARGSLLDVQIVEVHLRLDQHLEIHGEKVFDPLDAINRDTKPIRIGGSIQHARLGDDAAEEVVELLPSFACEPDDADASSETRDLLFSALCAHDLAQSFVPGLPVGTLALLAAVASCFAPRAERSLLAALVAHVAKVWTSRTERVRLS